MNSIKAGLLLAAASRFVDNIIPKIEIYREKQVAKHDAEKALEYSEYTKVERYKHRVRIVDIFLPALKELNADLKKINILGED